MTPGLLPPPGETAVHSAEKSLSLLRGAGVHACQCNPIQRAPPARTAIGNQDMSIEAAVVGIVDRVDLTDTKSEELREVARSLGRDNGSR